ncbi:MAG TPA: PIN domain-containing protein [Solirubrobacteraceae bacterium]|nr:PIN domain-containing protein [Solirubrobacteraceae bacterium]
MGGRSARPVRSAVKGLTLDTGALIALERGEQRITALLDRALATPDAVLHIPAAVLAQAFRDGRRQVRLVRLLGRRQTTIVPLDDSIAYAIGALLGAADARDVVDASVVLCARLRRQGVATSDPDDLRRLDPSLLLTVV